MKQAMLISAVLMFFGSSLFAETLFFDDFSDPKIEDRYEFDNCEPEIRDGNSPEFGPKVQYLDDAGGGTFGPDNSIVYVKDLKFTDGIIEALWRDARLPEDVDGPLFARAQDTGMVDCYVAELDTDAGLHLKIMDGGVENIQEPLPSLMSTGDWTWMKLRLEGPSVKVRTWLATEDEPEEWQREIEDATFASGRVGLESWSGASEVAVYIVSDLGGRSLSVEFQDKLGVTWGSLKERFAE